MAVFATENTEHAAAPRFVHTHSDARHAAAVARNKPYCAAQLRLSVCSEANSL